MLVHLHFHLCACSTPLYSGGTWYISAYRPNIRSGFCVSPGRYQDCFLPHPLQLFTSYHLTIYSLSYSEYHEINCEYADVCQVVSRLPFFSLSHPTLHKAAKKIYLLSKNYEVPRYIFSK